MALPALARPDATIPAVGGAHSVPGSIRSDWVVAHTNLKAAAASAGVLKAPLSCTAAEVVLMRVPDACTRVYVRGRYATGVITSMTTQPVVQVYSIFFPNSGALPYTGTDAAPVLIKDGTVRAMRVDATTQAGTAQTVTLIPSTDIADDVYSYTDCPDQVGWDLRGGAYCLVLVKTAGVINVGAGAIDLQAMFTN